MTLLFAALFLSVAAIPRKPIHIKPSNPKDPLFLESGVTRKVLIVGGGLAGLSAALELSERGFDVTLKESRDHLGGRLDAFKSRPFNNETEFNVEHGFHAWFYNYFNFDDILTRLDLHQNFRPWDKVEYIFRNYKRESIYSEGPYPLNLLGILTRSPNINIGNALASTFALPDLAFFNYAEVYKKYDHLTLGEWAELKKVSKPFYDVIMDPAISVTLNSRNISAAEMLTLMQLYFLSEPDADKRRVTIMPYNRAVIDPWADRLRQYGVKIQLNSPVSGLVFNEGKAVGEVDSEETYDFVVMAADLPAQKKIYANSQAQDDTSEAVLQSVSRTVNRLKVARPYKVIRVWFDRQMKDQTDILETPEHRPINIVVQYHLLEDEFADWAAKTGGSVIEFHTYDVDDAHVGLTTPEQVWAWIKPTVYEIYPELADFKTVGFNLNQFENFPSFEKGQHFIRPYVDTPSELGAENLVLAGDWVQTPFPSFIMERAVSTGRLAANYILKTCGVREVPLKVVNNHGPGFV